MKPRPKLPITISNPFSARILNPKINDGVTPYSCGVRCQYAGEHPTFGAAAPMIMYLYPSLTGGLSVFRSQLPSYQHSFYGNHVKIDGLAGGSATQSTASAVVKWRLVSQALKLSLINNCEANDGWFEAIRVDTPGDNNYWQYTPFEDQINSNGIFTAQGVPKQVFDEYSTFKGNPPTSGNPPVAAPVVNTGTQEIVLPGADVASIGSFATHPTYVTGKLKDLHKYVFQLRPNTREHEFNTLSKDYLIGAHDTVDPNWDSIIIKIYGRSYPANTAAQDAVLTRVHAHVISNQELVFDESVPLARYMTNTKYVEEEMQAAKRANTQVVKAAYISKAK